MLKAWQSKIRMHYKFIRASLLLILFDRHIGHRAHSLSSVCLRPPWVAWHIGFWAHSFSSFFLRPQWVVWHTGHRAHSLSSVCLSQIRANWLTVVIRFVGRFRSGRFTSLLSHDFQSTMLWREKRTTSLVPTVAKQYKLFPPNTES